MEKEKDFHVFRLEYNYDQGHFHLDTGSHPANTFGWVTICEEIRDPYGSRFIAWVWKIYKGDDKPSIYAVKVLFKEWSSNRKIN